MQGIVSSTRYYLLVGLLLASALPQAAAGREDFGLRLRRPDGSGERPAPTLDLRVELKVTGPILRARVIQSFANDGDDWVEGVYVYPLPEEAAVDALRMRVGERVIEGEIREREEARRVYREAREAGQRASLVEQERPNLFTTSVAPIGPRERVEIEIEYQQLLRYASGAFEVAVPLALLPRYVPGEALAQPAAVGLAPPLTRALAGLGGARGGSPATALVSDAHRVTPASVAAEDPRGCRVALELSLDPGFPLLRVESPSHPGAELASTRAGHRVVLDDVPADRDFVLRWWPLPGEAPRAAFFSEEHDAEHYVLAMILPPDAAADAPSLSRELVLVIDTSGSMAGTSIEQARAALEHALASLGPDDYFNVIRFAADHQALFPASRRADREALRVARGFVASLRASGGTEMRPALAAALRDEALPVAVRQIVFVTDGSVANEEQIFAEIERGLGRSRLFPVGIGAAPNRHLLTRLARLGRGAGRVIARPGEVGQRMGELLAQLERPQLADLELHWNDAVESWPARPPDLYAGEPLFLTARLPRFVGDVRITGRRGERPWEARQRLRPGRRETGIAKLWARRKIAALLDARRRLAGRERETRVLRDAVVQVAVAHHLVSPFTSLVSVDRTPLPSPATPLLRHAVPATLPVGSHPESLPGVLPRAATPAPWLLRAALVAGFFGGLGLWRERQRSAADRRSRGER